MQKHEVINGIMKQYAHRAPVHRKGLELLYDRAENRGYNSFNIYLGLQTEICKNYIRSEYIPPDNDITQEVIHERIYIEDWELREIFSGGGYNG